MTGMEASPETLKDLLDRQRRAYAAQPFPDREQRSAWLTDLLNALERSEKDIIAAVSEDFGHRSSTETLAAEIILTIGAIRAARRNLRRWMRPRRVATPLFLWPASSRLEPQPLGVVGIIAPWNYPVQLALGPLVAALAAGNRAMIKPSELTPRTSALLADIIAETFSPDEVTVVQGDAEIGAAFAALPFDHLLFTGSTAVGRKVAQAAAANLTPVTLELGGKSPAIIDDSADIGRAAQAIAYGKLFSGGQTCIAPDYVLTPVTKLQETVDALGKAAIVLYPDLASGSDYTSIATDRHFERLENLIEEAGAAGAKIVEIGDAPARSDYPRRLRPRLVVEPPSDVGLMQEEIFGPVLPVLSYETPDDAIARVNDGPRPLALYWFGSDSATEAGVLRRTCAGGVTINDTLLQFAQENLPFGGVGASGMGRYHGVAGFETFSHMKPVLRQSRFATTGMMRPPYTDRTSLMLRMFRRLV